MQARMENGKGGALSLGAALCWAVAPYIVVGLVWLIYPGLMRSFQASAHAQIVACVLMMWQTVGISLLMNIRWRYVQALVILLFCGPIVLLSHLGLPFTFIGTVVDEDEMIKRYREEGKRAKGPHKSDVWRCLNGTHREVEPQ